MGRRLRQLSTPQLEGEHYIIETQCNGKTDVNVYQTRAMAVKAWNSFIDRSLDAKRKCWIRVSKITDGLSEFINEWGEYEW